MYRRNYTGTVSCVLCREVFILCPYLGESTICMRFHCKHTIYYVHCIVVYIYNYYDILYIIVLYILYNIYYYNIAL